MESETRCVGLAGECTRDALPTLVLCEECLRNASKRLTAEDLGRFMNKGILPDGRAAGWAIPDPPDPPPRDNVRKLHVVPGAKHLGGSPGTPAQAIATLTDALEKGALRSVMAVVQLADGSIATIWSSTPNAEAVCMADLLLAGVRKTCFGV